VNHGFTRRFQSQVLNERAIDFQGMHRAVETMNRLKALGVVCAGYSASSEIKVTR